MERYVLLNSSRSAHPCSWSLGEDYLSIRQPASHTPDQFQTGDGNIGEQQVTIERLCESTSGKSRTLVVQIVRSITSLIELELVRKKRKRTGMSHKSHPSTFKLSSF